MEAVTKNKRLKRDSSEVRKGLSVGTRVGNLGGGGGRRDVIQQEEFEVMVISDDSNPDVTHHNGSITSVLPPESLAKFGLVEETHTLQNGTNSLETIEFVVEKSDIHKPSERTLNRNDGDRCNTTSKRKNICEEVVISDAPEKEDSGGTIVDQDEASVAETSVPETSIKYNFDNPLMALNYMGEFKIPADNFTKGCKWSPDGSCLLVAANDSKLRLFNLPTPVVQGQFQCESWFAEEAEKYSRPAVTVREKEVLYDYCWYPFMRSDRSSSCCLATTSKDHPIHLWDAWDGCLICSYNPYNHLDELVAAYSIEFNTDGTRLVAGFNKCIRIFHTQRPGRYCDQIDTKHQPGIISCMSFNPGLPCVFAAGSYLGSIGLYNMETNKAFYHLDDHMGGVTQVKFSSCGTKLYSGCRKDNEIRCWDMRYPGTVLCSYGREVSTNQRIYFDLEPYHNKFLVSGDTRGRVLKWDLEQDWEAAADENVKEPSSIYTAHKDCTNGVSIHPYCPLLATSSGQRHFPEPVSEPDVHSGSESEEPQVLFTRSKIPENTVKLWWLGES